MVLADLRMHGAGVHGGANHGCCVQGQRTRLRAGIRAMVMTMTMTVRGRMRYRRRNCFSGVACAGPSMVVGMPVWLGLSSSCVHEVSDRG